MSKPMSIELNLRFPDSRHLFIILDRQSAGPFDFAGRITAKDRKEIRWYLETYAAHYTTDVDDTEARRIEAKLPEWGAALFEAALHDCAAQHLFSLFQEATTQDRLLTISAADPVILSLPWELLRDPKGGYLFNESPPISIRRRVAEPIGELRTFDPQGKSRLRLLFVTSRPLDAGFIDPRSEPQVVIDAVEKYAPGRIEVEFLRPATFRNLAERLADKRLATVDVIHFDGHGTFDAKGSLGDRTPNTGYLLFERASGLKQFISPKIWHQKIGNYKIPLVILSACQSAAVSDGQDGDEAEEPIGSVAYGLTALGVPAVMAMTHSLLVETAGQLFGEFYRHLAQGKGVGTALDNARRHLMQNPEKHLVQRGTEWVRLTMQDWFLPALYQARQDVALVDASARGSSDSLGDIKRKATNSISTEGETRLPPELPALQEAGFFGRQRELWDIERLFVGGIRRISITGFGGQGKTYLATEAGRWLLRTGMFERVAFVSYASFQGVDALGYAVATLGSVLNKSLTDARAARAALRQTPVLVILDNLDDLKPAPLKELLGVAKTWSECGNSRVLLTSRAPEFRHADHLIAGSPKHRGLALAGLDPKCALSYFQSLTKLPPEPKVALPKPDALLELFKLVDFHPLSINLLAVQLKTRLAAELGARLESLLVEDGDDKNNNLRASIQLSLNRLDVQARQWLPRLGVFQGGAWETSLLAITKIPNRQWIVLREQLRAAALIEVEWLGAEGVGESPYLKFHPTLGPLLWSKLPKRKREAFSVAHRKQYYYLAHALDVENRGRPYDARAVARRELPNLLYAAHGALEAREEWASTFAETVSKLVDIFNLNRDAAALAEQATQAADAGSERWFSARIHHGQLLWHNGHIQEAEAVFREVLVGRPPSYQRCRVLGCLGLCYRSQGRPDLAEESYRDLLTEAEKLDPSDAVKSLQYEAQMGIGDALTDIGRYAEARAAYEASLAGTKELRDSRSEGLVNAQLGALALTQRDFPEAAHRYSAAINLFQRLGEPAMVAIYQHQLGFAFQGAGQWEEAERLYRESARIAEARGDWAGAANTWSNLAGMSESQAAEAYYRRAVAGYRKVDHSAGLSRALTHFAILLQNRPGRLAEARGLAEEALAIKQTLDHGAMQIWNTYSILAEIAEKEFEPAQAMEYRRQARAAYCNHSESSYTLRQYAGLIALVSASIRGDLAAQHAVGLEQKAMCQAGTSEWIGLANAIEQILAGEREPDSLNANLYPLPSLIVEEIIDGLKVTANPRSRAPH